MTRKEEGNTYATAFDALVRNLCDYGWVIRNSYLRGISKDAVDMDKYPCIVMEDIAFVACIHCTQKASIAIDFAFLDILGVDKEMLLNDILNSLEVKHPIIFSSLSAEAGHPIRDEFAYLCSQGSLVPYGASVLLYSDFIPTALAHMGGDFYILPASTHELLLIKADKAKPVTELLRLVQRTNAKMLHEDDILTDSIYYCSRDGICRVA